MQGKRTGADEGARSDALAIPPDAGSSAAGGGGDAYPIDYETLEIPAWLKISAEDRKAAWANYRAPIPARKLEKEEWQLRMERVAAARAQAVKDKNARGLAKVKEKHAGERYIRPKKDKNGFIVRPGKWVPKE